MGPPLASQDGFCIVWEAFAYYEPLEKVLSYVSANPDRVLSLAGAASVAGMSRSQFAWYFHRTVGVPYKYWFDFVRVKRAITMLRFTSKSMLEVAEECGFDDATTFTRTFRRIEGVTPREFRRTDCRSG
jgi:transcriptional regulator GlxA family with amidase domain